MTATTTELQPIEPDALEIVSGGTTNNDQMTSLLSQITSSLKTLGYNHDNTNPTDMMLMMMVMMGSGGGGGGGGFGFGGGGFFGAHVGGGCGAGPFVPAPCCPPCKGW